MKDSSYISLRSKLNSALMIYLKLKSFVLTGVNILKKASAYVAVFVDGIIVVV